jgi:Mrp family chromosome partitioning ATPase
MGLMLDALRRIEGRLSAVPPEAGASAQAEPPAPPEPPPPAAADVSDWCRAALDTATAQLEALEEPLPRCPDVWNDDLPPSPESEPPVPLPVQPSLEAPDEPSAGCPDVSSDAPAPSPAPEPPCPGPYQRLAAGILAQLTPGRGAVLMFTSPCDGRATAAVLAQLAPALAERTAGGVLLVDADFQHPQIAGQFGADAAAGLCEALSGKAGWSDAVRPTAVPRLHVLPGGPLAAGQDGTGESPDLGRLLRELAPHYALVLVAAGPLSRPEAAPIAAACEGTYLVAPLGQTSRRAVRQAARAIRRCRGRLMGCVAVELG